MSKWGKNKISFLSIVSLVIALFSLVIVVILSAFFTIKSREYLNRLKTIPSSYPKEVVKPSDVLAQKGSFSKKMIVVRGKVITTPIVCERKECPPEDPCCGCPSKRDLVMIDADKLIEVRTGESLRLTDQNGESLCYREEKCQYNCGDWKIRGIYDIYGEFLAEAPPPGWRKYLDFYFRVESKKIVEGEIAFLERINRLIKETKGWVTNSFKGGGLYVLP